MRSKILIKSVVVIVLLAALAGCSDMFEHKWNNYRGRRFGFSKEEVMKHRQKSLARLSRDLKLTQEQQTKVSEILDSGWQKIEAQYRDMLEKTRAVRTETDSKIAEVLTPQQLKKFKDRRAEFRSRYRRNKDRGSRFGRMRDNRRRADMVRGAGPGSNKR